MTNLSDLTRKEQVLERLRAAHGGWVDGTELATAAVGGSEGLKRLRELRAEGHDIRKRAHPSGGKDIYQYRLVPQQAQIVGAITASHMEGDVRVVDAVRVDAVVLTPEPAETYDYKREPVRSAKAHLGRTEDGRYIMVRDEPPAVPAGQMDMGVPAEVAGSKFTTMPGHLELGRTVPCPVCGGYRRAIRERDPITNKQKKGGKIIAYEELSRDPRKQSESCQRCNGFGVVPA